MSTLKAPSFCSAYFGVKGFKKLTASAFHKTGLKPVLFSDATCELWQRHPLEHQRRGSTGQQSCPSGGT